MPPLKALDVKYPRILPKKQEIFLKLHDCQVFGLYPPVYAPLPSKRMEIDTEYQRWIEKNGEGISRQIPKEEFFQ